MGRGREDRRRKVTGTRRVRAEFFADSDADDDDAPTTERHDRAGTRTRPTARAIPREEATGRVYAPVKNRDYGTPVSRDRSRLARHRTVIDC